MVTRFHRCPQGGHFGDTDYTISQKHAALLERSAEAGRQITIYVLSCPDYVHHHRDDTITEQVNGNIPIKTQQRVEMALGFFPDAQVTVLIADSEVVHEGKNDTPPEEFLQSIETTKLRIQSKYPGVQTSTFFEFAGGMASFLELRDHFYGVLESKVKIGLGKDSGKDIDKKLNHRLQLEKYGTAKRLSGRGIRVTDEDLLKRILKNSFAEMLAIGELMRKFGDPSGVTSVAVVYDQSTATGLINDGQIYRTRLKHGLPHIPLILANSASTV